MFLLKLPFLAFFTVLVLCHYYVFNSQNAKCDDRHHDGTCFLLKYEVSLLEKKWNLANITVLEKRI